MAAHNISPRRMAMMIAEEKQRTAAYQREQAIHIISEFNLRLLGGLPLLQSPLLRAALISRHHWMHVRCDGCNTSKAVDLTVIRRPEETALIAVAKSLKCQRCGQQAPAARIVKLSDSHEF